MIDKHCITVHFNIDTTLLCNLMLHCLRSCIHWQISGRFPLRLIVSLLARHILKWINVSFMSRSWNTTICWKLANCGMRNCHHRHVRSLVVKAEVKWVVCWLSWIIHTYNVFPECWCGTADYFKIDPQQIFSTGEGRDAATAIKNTLSYKVSFCFSF